jgi:hypothetical protein
MAGETPGLAAELALRDGFAMRVRPSQPFDRYCVIKMDSGEKRNTDQFAAFETEAEADVWVRARLTENPARPQVPTDAH